MVLQGTSGKRRADLQKVHVNIDRGAPYLLGVLTLPGGWDCSRLVLCLHCTCGCWSLGDLSAQLSQCLKSSENCCTVLYLSTKLLSLHHLKNIQLYISSEIFLLYTSHQLT